MSVCVCVCVCVCEALGYNILTSIEIFHAYTDY